MSLIVEDGTGVATAESYISVADADTYFSNRANTAWAALSTATKEAYLRLATDYMMGTYRGRWLGRRVTTTQALDWPRVGVVIEDYVGQGIRSYGLFQVSYTIVPAEVKNACALLGDRVRINGGTDLAPDLSQKAIEKTVGPVKVKYDPNSPQYLQYRQIDNMLRVYLAAGGNTNVFKLLRA